MGALRMIQSVHYRLGTQSACGLKALDHRNVRTTIVPAHVSCKSCRRWMTKNGVES